MVKLVLRLLTADNRLLGWVEHQAVMQGDGCLRSSGPVIIEVDEPGEPACISIHWCELHVETRVPCPPGEVKPKDKCAIFASQMPMVNMGEPPVGLPPVTVKSPVRITIPPGQLGVSGHAGG